MNYNCNSQKEKKKEKRETLRDYQTTEMNNKEIQLKIKRITNE